MEVSLSAEQYIIIIIIILLSYVNVIIAKTDDFNTTCFYLITL